LNAVGGGDGECSPSEEQLPRLVQEKPIGSAPHLKDSFQG
jgi:hypothetical protein